MESFYKDITIYLYYDIDIDDFFDKLTKKQRVEMTNLLLSLHRKSNNSSIQMKKDDMTNIYFDKIQLKTLQTNGKITLYNQTFYLYDMKPKNLIAVDKTFAKNKRVPVDDTRIDIYNKKPERFKFAWKYAREKIGFKKVFTRNSFSFALVDNDFVDTFLKPPQKNKEVVDLFDVKESKEYYEVEKPLEDLVSYIKDYNQINNLRYSILKRVKGVIELFKEDHENSNIQTIVEKLKESDDRPFLNDMLCVITFDNIKKEIDENKLDNFKAWLDKYKDYEVAKELLEETKTNQSETYEKIENIDGVKNIMNTSWLGSLMGSTERFIPSSARDTLPKWSDRWTVTEDIELVVEYIQNRSQETELAWKLNDNVYLRVSEIQKRMLRLPLIGTPIDCRLSETGMEDKKTFTFCCLLMLSVSYSVPLLRVVSWEIVNKTWMMMLHQYKNIINEDGFWLVDIPEEKLNAIKKIQGELKIAQDESIEDLKLKLQKLKEDLQVTFHGGRLLELVVRIYNFRITADSTSTLKLFKPGVNNYRTYLEKYFEKMQPFMTPLEVVENDHISIVLLKEGWSHPKSLVDDVVEPFCKNMNRLLGFENDPKIVYNDYFE